MKKDSIKLSLEVSPQMNDIIEAIARNARSSKSDILKKSLLLYDVILKEKEKGYGLAFINDKSEVIKEIIGI